MVKQKEPVLTPIGKRLVALTGKDSVHWFRRVQALIVEAHVGKKVKGHHRNRMNWYVLLGREVLRSFPQGGPAYDPNMRLAATMGLILTVWYARVHRAKLYDPNRPLQLRRDLYANWIESAMVYASVFIDERDDAIMMDQKWNNPFWPGAKGGKFV